MAKAVEKGDLKVVGELLAAGLDPNARIPGSSLGYTPLFLAVHSNRTAVTEALLKAGADPRMEDGNGDPVMVHAAHKDSIDQARLLIRHGVSIDSRSRSGITALLRAASYDEAADVQTKLDLGADPELTDDEGFTALMKATGGGNAAAMEVLLKAGAKPNAVNKAGNSALMLALSSDFYLEEKKLPSVVKLLIEGGADPDFNDREGANALILALDSYRCPPETIDVILGAKPDLGRRDHDGGDALFHAMSYERTRGLAPRLLELGANLKTTDNDGTDLLMLAAYGNDPDQVRSLLELGLPADRKTKSGETAVHYALRSERWKSPSADVELIGKRTVEILKLLHERGASLALADMDGDTPLHLAATSGQDGVFAWLLPYFENPAAANHRGETPLHLAASSSAEIVNLLLPKYPDPDVRDLAGRTALMNASAAGYEDSLVSLLKGGANIDATDKSGASALDEAVAANSPDKIRLLIANGADSKKLPDPDAQLLRISRLFQDQPINSEDYAYLVGFITEIARDIDARDSVEMTALMWLAASNNAAALEALLKREPALDLRSPDGRTALMWAACSRAGLSMEILREAGADASLRDSTGRTAGDWLAWSEERIPEAPRVIGADALLLKNLTVGREAALRDYLEHHEKWSEDDRVAGMPPLHLAAALGEIGAIRQLLERGAPPNPLREKEFTPLMAAAANGENDAVRFLLDRGASPSLRDSNGDRAIDFAIQLKHPATARLFLRRENPLSPDESALLAALVWLGDEALLKDFLESGASILPVEKPAADCDPFDQFDRDRSTPEAPMVAAALQKDSKMLAILAAHPKATGAGNAEILGIALQTAAENGRLASVRFLIEDPKADPDGMMEDSLGGVLRIESSEQSASKPANGFTALSRALENGHPRIVRYLIGKGATVTGRTRSGDSPLTFAIHHHQTEMLEYLLKHKAPTDLLDLSGLTALHVAAAANDDTATRLLLDHGADPDSKSPRGDTPLDMARHAKAGKTISLLESRAE